MGAVMVVGGAGYIGSHVALALKEKGHEVIVLDNLCAGHKAAVKYGDFFLGDSGDRAILDRIFSTREISCVMHFAAYLQVGESVEQPLRYYRNNTSNTVNLLDAMKLYGVSNFVFSSSAAVYGEPESVPIEESNPKTPTNPYGQSKLMVEKILADCNRAHGLSYTALRYFNAAGAHESGEIGEDHSPETHLIPLTIQRGMKGEAIKVFGTDWPTPDGTCLRDYIHVSDLAEAHILAMERLLDGGKSTAYNLGCQQAHSVKEVIALTRKVTGLDIAEEEAPRRAGDPAVLSASSQKAMQELGWKPRRDDLEKIITTAWNWHKGHPNGYED
jgi:UDP-glucose 4-epimerase